MPRFVIPIIRIGYGFKDICVNADSQEQAERLALDEAGNYEFSEKNSDYELADGPDKNKETEELLRELYNDVYFAVEHGATELARLHRSEAFQRASKKFGIK